MKGFDLTELKKSVRMQESSRSKSISDISKLSARNDRNEFQESYYLSRWGQSTDAKDKYPWTNIGQGIVSVASGEKHALILNNKHECYVCGDNQYGQLATEQEHISKPIQLSMPKDVKVTGVYCGSYHSFIITNKNDVYAFGLNMKGQLGVGSYEN
jgi:mitogen-activated protein kinase kinase kinase 9